MNIFEKAAREAYRFPSSKGGITTEDLWSLPLTSKSGFDLDNVAKAIARDLKAMTEESFVVKSENRAKEKLEMMLELVKHIIVVKQDESAALVNAAAASARKAKLLDILAKKQDASLESLSEEELIAQIKAM